jgi:hypothetical protein
VPLAYPPCHADPAPSERSELDVSARCYLTDGYGLYRTLGSTADETERLICVEDCVSLEVLLIPLDTVRSLRLVSRERAS